MTDVTITDDMIEYAPHSVSYDDYHVVTISDHESYKIEMPFDQDATINDLEGESYSDGDKEAWSNDQWYYVGVIVTPLHVPEHKGWDLSDSLWGLEFGFPLNPPQVIGNRTHHYTDATYLICHYPVPDMIAEVRSKVAEWEAEEAYKSYALS